MSVATAKRDYYEVLSVAKTADGEEIKRAYRRLAMKYHPDRADGDKSEAELRFKECAEAYEVLSDPAKRKRYDQFGHGGVSGQHDFSHMDIGDIFSMFNDIFGGAGGGLGGPRPPRGGRPRGPRRRWRTGPRLRPGNPGRAHPRRRRHRHREDHRVRTPGSLRHLQG